MPRRNRVTPAGEIIITPARGTFLGNRGVLHNQQGEIVRMHQGKRWIICQLSFKGRRRPVMTPGRYTELFFLDEATALAVGHRPCRECRRHDFDRFASLWRRVHGGTSSAGDIDARLHSERTAVVKPRCADLNGLPDGTFVQSEDGATLLVWQGQLWTWTPFGYAKSLPLRLPEPCTLLTPSSTLAVLQAGYAPVIHPTCR